MVEIKSGDIIFGRNNGLMSKIIRMRTLSQWSRVGIVTGRTDGSVKVISAKFNDVVYDCIKDWGGQVQILRVKNITEEQVNLMLNFAMRQVGKKYGCFGFLDFILRQRCQSGCRWFGSELVYYSLLNAGICLAENKTGAELITPGDLYESPLLSIVANIK